MKRAKENLNLPKVHVYSTFFYKTLSERGYDGVRRWSKNVLSHIKELHKNIFALDFMIIPVHLGNHWVLSVINFKKKRFEYYDSLHGTNRKCLKVF